MKRPRQNTDAAFPPDDLQLEEALALLAGDMGQVSDGLAGLRERLATGLQDRELRAVEQGLDLARARFRGNGSHPLAQGIDATAAALATANARAHRPFAAMASLECRAPSTLAAAIPILIRSGSLTIAQEMLESLLRSPSMTPDEIHPERSTQLVECLRLAGELERVRMLIAQGLPVPAGHPAWNDLDWQALLARWPGERPIGALARMVGRGGAHRLPNRMLIARLLAHTLPDAIWIERLPKARAVREAASELGMTRAEYGPLVACAEAFDDARDDDIAAKDRCRRLAAIIDQRQSLPSLDSETLALAAAAAEFRRLGREDLATMAAELYARQCLRISGGKSQDLHGITSQAPLLRASTPRLEEPPPASMAGRTSRLILLGGDLALAAVTHKIQRTAKGKGDPEELRNAELVRYAEILKRRLGRLKGIYMKWGQLAAFVNTMLPEAFAAELRSIQVEAPGISPMRIRSVVEEELGAPLDRLYAEWSDMPLAAASIGQVHKARLPDGTAVAVKVQYPGVERGIRADLRFFRLVLPLFKLLFPNVDVAGILREAAKLSLGECDYRREARHQDRFRQALASVPGISVPQVHLSHVATRVLTTDYVEGLRHWEFARLASAEERAAAAYAILEANLCARLEHRLINADPHPGNFLFASGTVHWIDFGSVSECSVELNRHWRAIVHAVHAGDREAFAKVLRAAGLVGNAKAFDFEAAWAQIHGEYQPFLTDDETPWGDLLANNFARVRQNLGAYSLPPDWFAQVRNWSTMAAVIAGLRPSAPWHRLYKKYLADP